MILRCPSCNGGMETPDDLIVGQHVICPYCQIKFALEANQKVEVDASESEILRGLVLYVERSVPERVRVGNEHP